MVPAKLEIIRRTISLNGGGAIPSCAKGTLTVFLLRSCLTLTTLRPTNEDVI